MCANANRTEDNRELTPTDYGKKLSSPSASHGRKFYSKIALSNRDSPTSRKSVDCLLNDELNSTSSNENVKKETNIDDMNDTDYNNNNNQNMYTEIPSEFNQDCRPSYTASFTSKISSLRNKMNSSRKSRLSSNNEYVNETEPHETETNTIVFQNGNCSLSDRDVPKTPCQLHVQKKDYEISTPNIPTQDESISNDNDKTDVLSQSLNLTPSQIRMK